MQLKEYDYELSNQRYSHDFFHTLNETNKVYGIAARALGREFTFQGREKETAKEDFTAFIKRHIDEGHPCIALGIIGPPEACIITGYRKKGEELLGWNFFQNNPEFAGGIEIDESGYFICKNWWENTDTQAVMCMGAIEGEKVSAKEIIAAGINVLSGRTEYGYAKGLEAYDAWKQALSNEKNFAVDGNYSVLFEKLLCQMDAMTCISDGRNSAADYFAGLAKLASQEKNVFESIEKAFRKSAKAAQKMQGILGSPCDMDGMLEKLAQADVREKLCCEIETAKMADSEALELMRKCI